jgi:glycine oxidase
MASSDVIIVGGGAIGAACARELARTGRAVLVIEAGTEMGQAWRAAAGMLAPQIEANSNDPLLKLGLAARDWYDGLAAALRETTGVDLGLWREGIGQIATEESEAQALQTQVAWQQQERLPAEWLDESELRRRWPWVGHAVGAFWAPRDGALDPGRLVNGLLQDAGRLGARVVVDRARAMRSRAGKVTGVTGEIDSYTAPEIVLAAGAWSGEIQGLPRQLPVQPVRGQMAALPWPTGIKRAIVYHRDCYLMARGAEAIVGSTMEYVGFQPEVTSAGLAEILSAGVSLCPALTRAKVRRSWAGLRPVTPDGLPVIGEEPLLRGLWYATGHGRNGILLAGLTGMLLTQLISGNRPSHDLTRFAAARFPSGADE